MLLLSYRGCWHRICRSFFLKLRHYLDIFMKGLYDQYNLHHPREIAGSSLRPLSKIPHCCLYKESGPYLSPSVTGHPLRPVKDHRLGTPLPYQLSNLPQAHQRAIHKSFNIFTIPVNSLVSSYVLLTRSLCLKNIQLACVKLFASVHSEPGSNS